MEKSQGVETNLVTHWLVLKKTGSEVAKQTLEQKLYLIL